MVGLAVGIFGFIQLPERIPLGAWSDHVGQRKPFVLLGIAATGIGGLVMVLGADPWFLVAGDDQEQRSQRRVCLRKGEQLPLIAG